MSCRLTSALADFDIVNGDTELRSYAARIPPIDAPRQLFAALQFPVVAGPAQPNGDFDTLKIEAADYDDGFAKVVHVTQPVSSNLLSEEPDGAHPQKDVGVRLAWDDEQLLIWQNRQLLADPATPGKRVDAPLGVFFYRVDVRETGDPDWHSLVRIRSKAALTLAGESIAPALTELETGVQVFPAKVNGAIDTAYWLPSYYTQWYGASLVLPDGRAAALDASGALAKPGAYGDAHIPANPSQKGDLYEPRAPRGLRAQVRPPVRVPRPAGRSDGRRARRGRRRAERRAGDERVPGLPAIRRAEAPDRHARRSAGRGRRGLGPVPPGPRLHRRPAAPRVSRAALHRARHRRRVPEAAGRRGVPPHRQARGPDDQGVPGRQLLRSRRRSHAGGRGREDAAPRQPGVRLRARALHPAVLDPAGVRRRSRGAVHPAARVPERERHRLRKPDRPRRPPALAGRHRRRRRHRAAEVARRPHHALPGVLRQAGDARVLRLRQDADRRDALPRRRAARVLRARGRGGRGALLQGRGSSPTSCRASTSSPIRRR